MLLRHPSLMMWNGGDDDDGHELALVAWNGCKKVISNDGRDERGRQKMLWYGAIQQQMSGMENENVGHVESDDCSFAENG